MERCRNEKTKKKRMQNERWAAVTNFSGRQNGNFKFKSICDLLHLFRVSCMCVIVKANRGTNFGFVLLCKRYEKVSLDIHNEFSFIPIRAACTRYPYTLFGVYLAIRTIQYSPKWILFELWLSMRVFTYFDFSSIIYTCSKVATYTWRYYSCYKHQLSITMAEYVK